MFGLSPSDDATQTYRGVFTYDGVDDDRYFFVALINDFGHFKSGHKFDYVDVCDDYTMKFYSDDHPGQEQMILVDKESDHSGDYKYYDQYGGWRMTNGKMNYKELFTYTRCRYLAHNKRVMVVRDLTMIGSNEVMEAFVDTKMNTIKSTKGFNYSF